MIPNPFIELFRSPVATLVGLGYALLLITLLVATLAACWRNAVTIAVRWDRQRPGQWEYLPPVGFLARVAAIPFVLAIDAWAVAALIWLITP
ncbi:hypothetical protein [Haloarcula sebkhae]|uniref:Uncharacterized protein n=2 Tax=Haloarcula sebkhae TaxID=932660 RepID=A0ACC6VIT9_9EURY|nr:hypothetical protein [Haloarcula sebkhae]GGK74622.1 hypothetical protein GCM10009067_28540 [Haloarcula sebkhae]